jgi:small glutamine-rich tetratricopeptide repeat-containing protein alpha
MREEEMAKNPKFAAIMEDVKINGPAAFQKYMGDPEVMQLMGKFSGMMQPGQGSLPFPGGAPPAGGEGSS